MRKLMLSIAVHGALALMVLAAPAQATNLRTWVSASGTDTGSCPQSAPCATFTFAIGVTSSGGEIDCLSGGDFGPVTIAQSITIDCGEGQVGGIGVTTLDAVNITATTGTIILRNLGLNGFGNDTSGIFAFGFNGTLIVQHCNIHGFGNFGIYFGPNSSRGLLEVSDTAIYGNGSTGVLVSPSSSVIASVVLNRVELNGNGTSGLVLQGGGVVAGTLRQSVAAENTNDGLSVEATGGVYFTVEESSVVDNLSDGIQANASGVNLEVGASTVGGNGTGVAATAGSVYTFGNNQISANGSNGSFTPGGPGLE